MTVIYEQIVCVVIRTTKKLKFCIEMAFLFYFLQQPSVAWAAALQGGPYMAHPKFWLGGL